MLKKKKQLRKQELGEAINAQHWAALLEGLQTLLLLSHVYFPENWKVLFILSMLTGKALDQEKKVILLCLDFKIFVESPFLKIR